VLYTLSCHFNNGIATPLRQIVSVVEKGSVNRSAVHLHTNDSAGDVVRALLAFAATLLLSGGVSCT
jgi:hypothetical protein